MEMLAMGANKETRRSDMDDLNRSLAIMAMVVSLPILMVVANIIFTICMGH